MSLRVLLLQQWTPVTDALLEELVKIIKISGTPVGYFIVFLLIVFACIIYRKFSPALKLLPEMFQMLRDIRDYAKQRQNFPSIPRTEINVSHVDFNSPKLDSPSEDATHPQGEPKAPDNVS